MPIGSLWSGNSRSAPASSWPPNCVSALKKNSSRLTGQLEAILNAIEVLPLGPPVDVVYGELRVALEQGGQPIGANDMLIAAHAMALGYILVTDREREFSRIEDLGVENWLRPT